MKNKTKSKTKKSTKKHKTRSRETIKRQEHSALIRKIDRYENNYTKAITMAYEHPTLTSILLFVALYPQLKNHINIHHYKEFHLLLQNDAEFRQRVAKNETTTDLEKEVFHYDLVPMLHHQLMDAVREMVVSGAGRKYKNTINKIADAIRPKGEYLCDHQ